jgi:cation diffusion facilitator CzcD-associated flavoprotein CzcO
MSHTQTETVDTETADTETADTETVDAVVVGAGFAGLYMLFRLRELGLRVRGFEAASDVGGTWWYNRYPGARCDVISMDYSFSFSKELEQDWDWSERFATQPEILSYANHVADRFDLRRDVRFDTQVTSAVFDEHEARWTVSTDRGDRVSARYTIMATGCLSTPKRLEIDGLDRFAGPVYHTGSWPHEGVDFSGQRVAVIGTGSSGIQCIPIIAEQAAHLTVFQRTPAFSMPAANAPLDPEQVDEWKARYAEHRGEARQTGFGAIMVPAGDSALAAAPDERKSTYQERWGWGVLTGLVSSYSDLLINAEANDTAAEFVRSKIAETVADPEVAATLMPKDYPFCTKRPCLDTGYYETYNRPQVRLVDLRQTPLTEVTPTGVRTSADDHDVDCIVLATGFDAVTGALARIDIRGRDGVALRDKWADGPRTYLGLTVAGFPNFFTITGPQSPSVLTNMMVSIEQHVEWIADCLDHLRRQGTEVIEATVEAEDAWVDLVSLVADVTLFPKANSWYMGANVPGKPRVMLAYVGGAASYRERCEAVVASGYQGFTQTVSPGGGVLRPSPLC